VKNPVSLATQAFRKVAALAADLEILFISSVNRKVDGSFTDMTPTQ